MGIVECPENKETYERLDFELQTHPTYDYEQKRTKAVEGENKNWH